MVFNVTASVGNGDGVFDAAYSFGPGPAEASMRGTPEEIGKEVTRFLLELTPEGCKKMEYGTGRFFIELRIEPDPSRMQIK